ncbi:MAG: hypothetical protein A2506_03845 [Elusimicrobia bacterium RIFOXYD12_FULL_66_9]|nr:MAG: hypothetical protein A2506_03845 [Elusimicrobia bacterium RIFOXYD12_FULL_66_9]
MKKLAPAAAAAAALAAMLFASRLPISPDYLLPRRAGYFLFEDAWVLFSSPLGRGIFTAATLGLLILPVVLLCRALWLAAGRKTPSTWSGRAGLALGPVLALVLAVRLWTRLLDLVQTVWFPYGSMSAWEPVLVFLNLFLILGFAGSAATAWVEGRRRRATLLIGALIVMDVLAGVLAYSRGVGRPLQADQPRGRTLFIILTETEKGPGRDAYLLAPDVFSDRDLRPSYEALASGGRDARTLPALRALYEEELKRWDMPGLRRALLLGISRGDVLAASLLLSHLSAVPPSPDALKALKVLADEDAYRVGPLGAAALARAYAHQGDEASASRWAKKAGVGPRGVPAGLLGLEKGSALKSGRISGMLRGAPLSRVALYRRRDPAAPYLLDVAGLVASARTDAKGRFVFTGLPAGRYYLALAIPEGARGEVSVVGHRGDIHLDARRPSRELPPLTVKSPSR